MWLSDPRKRAGQVAREAGTHPWLSRQVPVGNAPSHDATQRARGSLDMVSCSLRGTIHRDRKVNANFFCTKFFRQPFGSWTSTPKIVDVRTKKCVFLRPRVVGRNFLTPGHPGARVRNVHGEIRSKKFMFMLFFLPWIQVSLPRTRLRNPETSWESGQSLEKVWEVWKKSFFWTLGTVWVVCTQTHPNFLMLNP